MYWNHRVVNCPSQNGGDDLFQFQEVFYDDDGKPSGFSDAFMCGNTPEELKVLLGRLTEALAKPALHENDFEKGAE